jgi:hypothetical protein
MVQYSFQTLRPFDPIAIGFAQDSASLEPQLQVGQNSKAGQR